MSAKETIKRIVDSFNSKPLLRDKTREMGEGLMLGASLADESNERSKEATATTKAIQEKYKEQILAQDLNPNKDPELVDLRNGNETAGERITKFENATTNKLLDIATISSKPTGSDDTEILNAALNAVADGGTLKIPKGHYIYNGKFKREFKKGVSIIADKGTVIDCTDNPNNSPDDVIFHLHGNQNEYAPLTSIVNKYSYSITADLDVKKGDIILISSSDSFNDSDRQYIKGEFCKVSSKIGDTIKLVSPLYDNYVPHLDDSLGNYTRVYKMVMPKISISDLSILCDGNNEALKIEYSQNLSIRNIDISGARQKGMVASYIYKGTFSEIYIDDCWYDGTGQSYGLNVNSSQHITFRDLCIFGGRHAIACGGWEPFRDIKFINSTADSHKDSGANSVDFHGNCDIIYVSGNEILNGIVMQGATNFKIVDNDIKRIASGSYAVHLYITKGMDYAIMTGNTYDTAQSNTIAIGLDFRLLGHKIKKVDISDSYFESKSTAIYMAANASNGTGHSIDTLIMNDNTVISDDLPIRIDEYPNISETRISIKEIQINGGYYYSKLSNTPILIRGKDNDRLVMDGVKIESKAAASAGLNIVGISKVYMNKNHVKNTGTLPGRNIQITCDYLFFEGNILENFNRSGGLDATVSTLSVLKDNVPINCLGVFAHLGFGVVVTEITSKGNYICYGNVAPTGGTWKVGDIVNNSRPLIGQPTAWICTVAGSPGTWNGYGSIQI